MTSDIYLEGVDYYAAIARPNWLLARVQEFKYRAPILEQIL